MISNISNSRSWLVTSSETSSNQRRSILTGYLSADSNLGQNKQVIINAIQDLNLTVNMAKQILINLEELDSVGNIQAVNNQAANDIDQPDIKLVTDVVRKLKGDHRSLFFHYGSTQSYKLVIIALKAINNGFGEQIRGRGRGLLGLDEKSYFFAPQNATFDKESFLYALQAKASLFNKNIQNLQLDIGELSKEDLKDLDLTETKLDRDSFISLYNAGVRNFSRCDLSGVDLQGKTFRGVNLIGAKLNGTDCRDTSFREAKLDRDSLISLYNAGGRNFSDCDLSGAKLIGAKLIGAKLIGANLNDANLSGADLSKADLSNAKLISAKLIGANLNDANLNDANLNDADLSKADLSNATLFGAKLIGVKLIGVKLIGANLFFADLSYADLSKAEFSKLSLFGSNNVRFNEETVFNNTNLSDVIDYESSLKSAELKNNCIISMDLLSQLTSAQLKNCKLSFNGGELNHTNNYPVLTEIDYLEDKEIKERFMLQVFEYLQHKDIHLVLPALKSILLNSSTDYSSVLSQCPVFRQTLLNYLYKCGNANAVTISSAEINFVLNVITNMSEESQKDFMLDNNNYFIQLIHHGRTSSKSEDVEKINTLWEKYCEIDEIRNAYEKSKDIFTLYNIHECLIFYKKESKRLLVVENEYLNKFLYQSSENQSGGYTCSWSSIVYINNQNIEEIGAKGAFVEFTLFLEIYNAQERSAKFTNLLKLLSLGDDYFQHFKNATTVASYKKLKLVDRDSQKKLNDIFNKYFVPLPEAESYGACSLAGSAAKNLSLLQSHLEDIFDVYDMKNESSTQKAKLLLILAGIFAQYSSRMVFGKDNDSPTALRYCAYGLMKAAYDLDKTVVTDDQYNDWTGRFLGINKAETCTQILNGIIVQRCKQFDDYSTHFSWIIPLAWRSLD